MPKGRPMKPHKVKQIKLTIELCPIAEGSMKDATETIELGLEVLQFLAIESKQGNKAAIGLLARFGVQADLNSPDPIVVRRPDGAVATWVVDTPAKNQPDKCLDIVATAEILGHSAMLQEYEDCFYLRVEDDGGAGILKTYFSRIGKIMKAYESPPEDERDFVWVKWAQDLIQQKQLK